MKQINERRDFSNERRYYSKESGSKMGFTYEAKPDGGPSSHEYSGSSE